MSLYPFVVQMKKLLRQIDGWLDKAEAHAAAKKFDATSLLQARLAPDMFPLVRQVQSTCDQAKYAVARTTGNEVPSHPDTEQTIAQLRQRVASVVTYLDGFSSSDFEGIGSRTVTTPRWEGKSMPAIEYFVEHAQPNFYFHYTMTYALLRHNGVEVGKRDFLGPLPLK
jgi:uncharacterized protein